MYGINLSRALTLAVKKAHGYRTMSSGRVQGPALNIIVQREKEIKAFKPKPFWQIHLLGESKKEKIEAWHKEDKFWEEEKADKVMEKTKGQDGKVSDVSRKQIKQQPPTPFDLTTLQTESYGVLGIQPKQALELAQDLYSNGYISYPRTSSQQLSPKIGFKNIIGQLMQNSNYTKLGNILLKKPSLTPNNGKKTDPAHPAIYPTGIMPKNLDSRHAKLYDLIVKRFFATFGDNAVRETMTVEIDVNTEIFIAKGTRTVEKGWHTLYEPYVRLKEESLPNLEKNDAVNVKKIEKLKKETQPPKRYTQASILKELEKRNLGTKATRAQILDNLFSREYITGKSLEATELGIKTIETLEQYSPEIIDENLTRSFEEEMEKIREKKQEPTTVLKQAKETLIGLLDHFKENEMKIGEKLGDAYKETEDNKNYIGKCPNCGKDTLQIRKSMKFKSRFIGCSRYPECKTIFSLPQGGTVTSTGKVCEECNHPIISVKTGKIPKDVCINPKCKTKEGDSNGKEMEKPCPKCKEGRMVLKKSIYGEFLACNGYPKCKNIENINGKNKDNKKPEKK